MDAGRFDDLARRLAAPGNRRRLLGAWLAAGAAAVGLAATRSGGTVAQVCADDGEPCGLMVPCCPGFGCVTLPANPNAGVCIQGAATEPGSSGASSSGPGGGSDNASAASTATATPRATATARATRTPEPTATATATPNPKDGKLDVRVLCAGPVERTLIKNTGKVDVTIQTLRVLAPTDPQGDREETIDKRLKPGATLRLTSGTGAKSGPGRIAPYDLYRDGTGGRVVAIETTAGTFRAGCGSGEGGDGGHGGSPSPRSRIGVSEVSCAGDPSQQLPASIKVTNVGSVPTRIASVSIDGVVFRESRKPPPGRREFRRVPLAPATAGEGYSVYFYFGPDAIQISPTARFLKLDELPGPGAKLEVRTVDGFEVSAICPPDPTADS